MGHYDLAEQLCLQTIPVFLIIGSIPVGAIMGFKYIYGCGTVFVGLVTAFLLETRKAKRAKSVIET